MKENKDKLGTIRSLIVVNIARHSFAHEQRLIDSLEEIIKDLEEKKVSQRNILYDHVYSTLRDESGSTVGILGTFLWSKPELPQENNTSVIQVISNLITEAILSDSSVMKEEYVFMGPRGNISNAERGWKTYKNELHKICKPYFNIIVTFRKGEHVTAPALEFQRSNEV